MFIIPVREEETSNIFNIILIVFRQLKEGWTFLKIPEIQNSNCIWRMKQKHLPWQYN